VAATFNNGGTMPASNYLKGKVIDGTVRGISFAAPATVYVSLHTADPTANATPATEISAGWYARQATAFAAQSTAGQTSNSGTVTYNGVSGSPVTATNFAVWDAATLGNMLYYAPLSAPKTFAVTDVPTWLPGTLTVTAT